MKTKTVLISAVLLLAVLLSACGPTTIAPAAQPPIRSLNVSGTGEVTLKPDIAYINIGVHTEKATASEATAQNNTDAQAVISALTAAGVAADDIQTSNFSIYQKDVTDPTSGAKLSTVYAVDNTVYVTVRNLDKLGAVLDATVKAGANNVNSIQFDLADKTKALSEARAKAVKAARTEADELAAAAGVTVGNVQTINYNENTPGPVYYAKAMAMDSAGAGVPVSSGTLKISVSVSISYEIK
jgi:uncharacterized protein